MKVYVETYGCTANKSDESIVKGILLSKGHEMVYEAKEADALIILTCTVIGSTEQRMLHRIKLLDSFNKKLIVSGCMAAVQSYLIKNVAPRADIVSPNMIHTVGDILEGKVPPLNQITKTSLPRYYSGVIAPIAISEGCNLSCSYCITSKARGKLISYPRGEIINTIENALKNGCREIQITSQDTASYGMDNGERLGDLIHEICKLKGEFRLRIGMMNPLTASNQIEELIEAFRHRKVYKFLHLPVQSGDGKVLKHMRRGYSVENFIDIVKKFRKAFPRITLSTDVIVGFPGENENNFLNTVKLIKTIRPDIVNITRFSPRPLTEAKEMKNKVPTHVSKERSRVLSEICRDISREKNEWYKNKKYTLLITEKGKNNTIIGRTCNYKSVIMKADPSLIGRFVRARIVDSTSTHLIGKLI